MSSGESWLDAGVVGDSPDGGGSQPVEDLTVRLEVPGRAAYLRYARLAAAAMGHDLGYSLATIEALRTAVDEICSLALVGAVPDTILSVMLAVDARRIDVAGSCGPVRDWSDPDGFATRVLAELALDHTVWFDGEYCNFRMRFAE